MKKSFPKAARIHLDAAEYDELRTLVLSRDGWRCQNCGSLQNLEVHHLQFRSHSGQDTEGNLITLCIQCHSMRHESGVGSP
jgi:5-methylcytosine-specific restriction endonuclease McrA